MFGRPQVSLPGPTRLLGLNWQIKEQVASGLYNAPQHQIRAAFAWGAGCRRGRWMGSSPGSVQQRVAVSRAEGPHSQFVVQKVLLQLYIVQAFPGLLFQAAPRAGSLYKGVKPQVRGKSRTSDPLYAESLRQPWPSSKPLL